MQQCAPSTDVRTLAAIVAVESNGDSWAVRDADAPAGVHPASYASAVVLAHGLLVHGHRVAVGLAQVLLPRPGLDSATLLGSPCANVRAGAAVLADFYGREIRVVAAPATEAGQQTALRRALSAYNSGSPTGAPGYTALVLSALQSPFVSRITASADGRVAVLPAMPLPPLALARPRIAAPPDRRRSPSRRYSFRTAHDDECGRRGYRISWNRRAYGGFDVRCGSWDRWSAAQSVAEHSNGANVYVPGAVHRGEFVQACLPDALASYAVAHEILFTGGACANGSEPIVKVLAGLPGDVVNVDRDVRVNGRTWPSSTIRSIDSRGRAVDLRLARGTFVVAAHSMLLLGLHPRSWDGRYFGALPSSAVTGRWFPILADKKVTL